MAVSGIIGLATLMGIIGYMQTRRDFYPMEVFWLCVAGVVAGCFIGDFLVNYFFD